ncbi:LOW QUALITY PROTEIN: hypothetical protein NC652_041803 [Populus alba x Populus x berolinensis]|nr:LOW QUALITY PROTEIN: hypothetical protein NC652_041803 [Populus alba x Populus x berolinensis]
MSSTILSFFAMNERKMHDNRFQRKWVMSLTCRQHTDFGILRMPMIDRTNLVVLLCWMQFKAVKKLKLLWLFKVHMEQSIYYCISILLFPEHKPCSLLFCTIKVEAVTRRILWIKPSDPKAKVLVFSRNHMLPSVNSERRKAVPKELIDNKKKQNLVAALNLHGANGLNLLEAQHVVLVEPLLNPAAEAQAVSRVHRIGQEKRTLVKDTVEESIYKLNRSRSTSSFIIGNTKNQDQPFLTLKDVESLFATVPSTVPESDGKPTENLRHLPPSVAAALAAERRLKENTAGISV